MLQTIIPSKDRPAQLDLLLRSIKRHVGAWRENATTILWRSTDLAYGKGYEIVRSEHPEFTYIQEERFRPDIQMIALGNGARYTQFLMDDDVYVRSFSVADQDFLNFQYVPGIVALVLRMAPYMDYCYCINARTKPPKFGRNRTWHWRGLIGDWCYSHSVDGTIWRTSTVQGVLAHVGYSHLHQLEPALRMAMTEPLAICYEKPRLVNVANNSVQDAVESNRHAGGDAMALNDRFLGGERILPDNIEAANPPSPHFEIDYLWGPA